jgi:hypothetical protein
MPYKKLLQYAKRINREDYEDLAHGFLLHNYERGRDILSADFNCSYVWVGLTQQNLNMIVRGKYTTTRNNPNRKRVFKKIEKTSLHGCSVSVHNTGPYLYALEQVKEIITKRANATKSPNTYLRLFELYPQGYKENEIAKLLGVSQQNLNRRKKKIQDWIRDYSNF